MKKLVKKVAALSTIIALAAVFSSPVPVRATVPPLLGFGGTSIYFIPCTCSFASWGFFAPLYLAAIPIAGPMVYYPAGTFLHPNYLPTVPLVPHDGAYIPGVQACWMYAGVTCVPLPSIGVMAFVGTGLPGGK